MDAVNDRPGLRALAAAIEAWRGLMDQVTTADLARTTANPGWDVAQVINHAIAVTTKFTRFADGTTDRPRTPGGDFVGTGHRAAFDHAAGHALTAWRHADLRRTCHLPFGTFTAEQAAGINLFDLLAHGWDIAQPTGAAFACPDGTWETGLDAARHVIGERRDPVHYAPELPTPPDAPSRVRFLRYLGRAADAGPRGFSA